MTFQEELTLLLIDKLALGALIGLVALIASVIIERYRARQALNTEIAKLRIAKISEIWKEYYRIIGEIENIHLSAMGIEHQNRMKMSSEEISALDKAKKISESTLIRYRTELIPRIEKIDNDVILLGRQMDQERFWIGSKLDEQHTRVYKNLTEYVHHMKADRLSESTEFSSKLYVASGMAKVLREDIISL